MSTEQIEKFQDEVVIPEGVTITQKKHMLEFVGPLGKTYKSFRTIPVKIEIVEGKVIIKTIGFRKRDYAILHNARSIIRNICEGLIEGYTIKMKINTIDKNIDISNIIGITTEKYDNNHSEVKKTSKQQPYDWIEDSNNYFLFSVRKIR